MATSLCYGEIRPLKNQNLKQSTVVHKKPIKTPPFLISLHFLQPLIKMLQHVLSLARGGVIISPQFSHQLHWLPVCQWIHFKIAGCVFQALTAVTGQAPTYFANDCHLISDSDRRRLRSSDIRTRVTPWTCTQFGDRSFLTPVPHIWNGLPSVLWVRTWCLTILNEGVDLSVYIGVMRSQCLVSVICVLVARPRRCPTVSNPVPWQNWMAAYLGYTLRMKTLFHGWPIMVHDTYEKKKKKKWLLILGTT